jgi:hypothetical protein
LAKPAQAIQLDVSDDDDGAAAPPPPPPGPLTDMSMDIAALRVKLGYTKPFEQQFSREATFAKTLLATGYGHTTHDGMFTTTADWKGYLGNYRGREVLFKGFPMVEEVVFIKHPNYWTNLKDRGKLVDSGQCYWLAMALILYGSADYWLRVKAEHLSFLETVLMNSQHPRHAFYTRENQTSGETQASGPGNQAGFTANLWERLQIPGCWNNEDMCQLTSEVYGVFVVLYKYDGSSNKEWRNKVYDMNTYGAYNSQHIFLCYSVSSVFDFTLLLFADIDLLQHENHFQPMIPNKYYAYDFKLPRLTLHNTKKYRLVTREHRRPADGPRHHWRARNTLGVPARPSFQLEHLKRAAGYGPYVKKVLPKPAGPGQAPAPATPVKPGGNAPGTSAQMTSKRALEVMARLANPAHPKPITQVDAQQAREAFRVLQNLIGGSAGAGPAGPLPASAPSALNQGMGPTPPSSSKRPASDPLDPAGAAKRQRPASMPATPTPASRPQAHAPALKPQPQAEPQPPQQQPQQHPQQQPQPQPRPQAQTAQPQGSQQPPQPQQRQPDQNRFYRTPSKSLLLNKTKLATLQKWCTDLHLAAHNPNLPIAQWKKEVSVDALRNARVEVLMKRVNGLAVPVAEGELGAGERGVRIPPPPVQGGAGSGDGGQGNGGQGAGQGGDQGGGQGRQGGNGAGQGGGQGGGQGQVAAAAVMVIDSSSDDDGGDGEDDIGVV